MYRLIALFAVALAASPALAQEKVALKTKHAEGDTSDVRTSVKMRLSGTVQGQTMSMKHESLEEFREKTLSLDEGAPLRAERTYKTHEQAMEQKVGAMSPQNQTQKNPIVGKTVVLVKKDGKVGLEAKPDAGTLEDDDIDFVTDDFDVLLPDEPVAVGGQWKVAQEKLAAMNGPDGPKATDATCTLEEVAETDGRKVARIAVKVTMKGEEGGATMSGELSGPYLFDLSAGRPLSIALKGTMKLDMGMATLEGPMEVESTVTSVK